MPSAAQRPAEQEATPALSTALNRAKRQWFGGDSAGAIRALAGLVASAVPEPEAVFFLAGVLIEAGEPESVASVLERLPDDAYAVETNRCRIKAAIALSQFPEANGLIADERRMVPDSAFAMTALAEIAFQKEDEPTATRWIDAALDADPSFAWAWQIQGRLAEKNGNGEAGQQAYLRGFQADPLQPGLAADYHRCLGQAVALGNATDLYTAAADRHPDSRQLAYFAIDLLLRDRRHGEALDRIRHAVALFGASDGILDAGLQVLGRAGSSTARSAVRSNLGESPQISLVVIARDEQADLARCLASVFPIVDEILVVDTGSLDRTVDVAELFEARIIRHAWADDFAEARNVGIAHASGQWILSLDADEVIAPSDHARLKALVRDVPAGTKAFTVVTRNYLWETNAIGWTANAGEYPEAEAGTGWFPSEKVRLFPNQAGIGFDYPVHELVEPSLHRSGISIRTCPVPVHHYGKLDPVRNRQKGERYFAIGITKLSEMADNPVALRELAVQALNLGQFTEAIDLWSRLAAQAPDDGEVQINLGTAYFNAGRWDAALSCAEAATALRPDLKEAWFNRALVTLHSGDPTTAAATGRYMVQRWPDYLAAEVVTAVAAAAAAPNGDPEALVELPKTALGQAAGVAVDELIQSLRKAEQHRLANRVAKAATESGLVQDPGQGGGLDTIE